MHRHQAARRSRADLDAVYRRLSGDGAVSTQAAFSRATQKSLQGWMETKGAEASGSNRESHMRALVALSQYPFARHPFRPIGVHNVERNEYLCQRSVSKLTRRGSYHPVEWDPCRTGPHLHRNGKRRLAPLPSLPMAMGTLKNGSSAERVLTPRRVSTSQGGILEDEAGRKTPVADHRGLGARSASPAFSPLKEPSLTVDVQKVDGRADGSSGSPPKSVGYPTPTAWGTIR
jgi:hypothetical protein